MKNIFIFVAILTFGFLFFIGSIGIYGKSISRESLLIESSEKNIIPYSESISQKESKNFSKENSSIEIVKPAITPMINLIQKISSPFSFTKTTSNKTYFSSTTIMYPMNRQVYQRDNDNRATITFVFPAISGVKRVNFNVQTLENASIYNQTVTLNPDPYGIFYYPVSLPAGGWYKTTIQQLDSENQIVGMGTIDKWGIGEVFVTAGQSNAANHGEAATIPSDDRISSFNPDTNNWVVASDPQPYATKSISPSIALGTAWPRVGSLLAQNLGVPIGFINTAIGGTRIRDWQEGASPFVFNGVQYPVFERFITAIKTGTAFNLRTKFRAILWQQGEGDTADGTLETTYFNLLNKLISDIGVRFGSQTKWIISNTSTIGPSWNDCSIIQQPNIANNMGIRFSQQSISNNGVATLGPDTDELMGVQYRLGWISSIQNGSCIHFSSNGLKELANRWVDRIKAELPNSIPGKQPNCKLTVSPTIVPRGNTFTLTLQTDMPFPTGTQAYFYGTKNLIKDLDGSMFNEGNPGIWTGTNAGSISGAYYTRRVVIKQNNGTTFCTSTSATFKLD